MALLAVLVCPSAEYRDSITTRANAVSSDPEATATLARLPLVFVENRGQWNTPASFVARKGAMTARLEKDGIVVQLEQRCGRGVTVRLTFERALGSVGIEGEGCESGRHNFFHGCDPSQWRTGVPVYRSVLYRGVHAGIDLRVREHEGKLEYDVCLAPGADLGAFVVRCEGAEAIEVEPDGSLTMMTALGPIQQTPPVTWEVLTDGERRPLAARFRTMGSGRFGFEVPDRDPSLALVIDPGLVYSTFLGGMVGGDAAVAVAVDASGTATLAGYTYSPDFPTTPGAFDRSFNSSGGPDDVFVTRLAPTGGSIVYSTFLGGVHGDVATALAVDPSGAATVAGYTYSPDFAVTAGAYDTSHNGGADAFITQLAPSGASLLSSTFLGGASEDLALAIALEAAGAVTVVGRTDSTGFPTTPGAFDASYNGVYDAFVTRLSPGASSLFYSTFLGGSDFEYATTVALDASGAATVGGHTRAADFPTTAGAYDTTYNGGAGDVFVTRLSNDGASLLYSTFLGGAIGPDGSGVRLALDATGACTLAGATSSPDFPTTVGAYDTSFNGRTDAFVTRLAPSGGSLVYSTFLGGTHDDGANALALDSSGAVVVAGQTSSWDLPTTPGAYAAWYRGSNYRTDGFVARLSPTGSNLPYSTFLGGYDADWALAVALDAVGAATVAGRTQSPGFPTTPGAYDTSLGGISDAFVTRLDLLPAGASAYGASTAGCAGPLAIGVTSWPQAGSTSFGVTCTRAPPHAAGVLAIGGSGLTSPLRILGVDVWVDLLAPALLVQVASNAVGAAEVPIPLPVAAGTRVVAQFVWLGPTSPPPCPPLGLSASNALGLVIQP